MKKILLIAMVIGIAIPALAADISLVDNGDCTATIKYTAAAGEVVRGLSIVVEADGATIDAVGGPTAEFNVFMDAAYEMETATPGSYTIGAGTPVANPDAAGIIALPAAKISLCMGVVDEGGGQGGAADDGTYDVATITLSGDCIVTITADALRGGIVGDAVVAGTVAGGPIVCGGGCDGDYTGPTPGVPDGIVALNDVTFVIDYFLLNKHPFLGTITPAMPAWDPKYDLTGPTPGVPDNVIALNDVTFLIDYFLLNKHPFLGTIVCPGPGF